MCKNYDFDEVCPYCDYVNEVDLRDTEEHKNGKRTLICENCGRKIFACNLCDMECVDCSTCSLKDLED